MSTTDHRDDAAPQAGDWLQARGLHGEAGRTGEVLEVLGRPGHLRFRVKWDEGHESIVFPADGVSITHAAHRSGGPPAANSRL